MTRVVRLTLLATDLVDEKQEPEVTLARVLERTPVEWQVQAAQFKAPANAA